MDATRRSDREAFLAAYVECAYWASTTDDGLPLDHLGIVSEAYDVMEPLGEDTAEQMRADCADFIDTNADDLADIDPEQAGHDFWLTRNRHGAGFWDRGLGEVGERLADASRAYGGVDLLVGEDLHIHAM